MHYFFTFDDKNHTFITTYLSVKIKLSAGSLLFCSVLFWASSTCECSSDAHSGLIPTLVWLYFGPFCGTIKVLFSLSLRTSVLEFEKHLRQQSLGPSSNRNSSLSLVLSRWCCAAYGTEYTTTQTDDDHDDDSWIHLFSLSCTSC